MTEKLQSHSLSAQRKELRFLEALRERLPTHPPLLDALIEIYARTGQYERAIRTALDLVAARPSRAETWYNLASCYALAGRTTDAIRALNTSIQLGYSDFEWLRHDAELMSLRTDPRFRSLLRKTQCRVH